jgi:exonuclease SbcD
MRILHLADVHLDRPFVGLGPDDARAARSRLRATFSRCLDLAAQRDADLVTIGGDLWENENVTRSTCDFVAHELAQVDVPVVAVCGNHDPYLPGGHYTRTPWPANVHLLVGDGLTDHAFGEVSVWGVSWKGGQLDAGFLQSFRAPEDGRVHLLLFHGTSQPVAHLASGAAVFDPAKVRDAGFARCLAGHIHAASERAGVVYPGSPEPLRWGETGSHCVAIVDVEGGEVGVELVPVNSHRYEEQQVDCEGCVDGAGVAGRLAAALADADARSIHLRAALTGEVARECVVDAAGLERSHRGEYAELRVSDRTTLAYDLGELRRQRSAAGHFVRLIDRRVENASDEAERELLELTRAAGLRALDGREDVTDVP